MTSNRERGRRVNRYDEKKGAKMADERRIQAEIDEEMARRCFNSCSCARQRRTRRVSFVRSDELDSSATSLQISSTRDKEAAAHRYASDDRL
jgi:hypothetical protein